MKSKSKIRLFAIIFALYLFYFNNSTAQTFNYSQTPRQPVADTIFGKVVIDDYRWMEDMNSQQMKDWLKVQTDFTNSLLDKIPGRNVLLEELKKIDQLTRVDIPYVIRDGGRYFYKKIVAGENIGKLYYREDKNGKEILLFDPSTYKSKTGAVAFDFIPSKDGKKVLLNLSEKGKEIFTNRFLNVDSKKFYSEIIYPGSIFGGSFTTTWTPDSKGIIYDTPQTTDDLSPDFHKDSRVMYHKVGTDSNEDKIILSRKHDPALDITPDELLLPGYSADGKYIIVTLFSGWQNQNRILFAPAAQLLQEKINWKTLVKAEDKVQNVIVYNEYAYFLSRKDAPKGKVLIAPMNNLTETKTIIPEEDLNIVTFDGLSISKDYLFILKTNGINSVIHQYNFKTKIITPLKLPFSGAAWLNGWDVKTNDCTLEVSSWKKPGIRYDYNPVSGELKLSPFNITVKYPGTDDLIVEELEVKSHDGVMVPLSLIYNKYIKKDGKNILYLTGYGSYGSSSEPWFKSWYLPLLNRGVIIAETHPRGGGEKGNAWHMGGFKTTKPNTWKDFISCANYLIENGYTSPKQIIGEGGSAGGILIGRTITDRPDLFAASIHNVPVSNALRHENRTIGGTDAKEFGTVKDSVEAMALIEMDAYLHVKKGIKYPAVLATAGINDSRVPAWQPGKFVAALQNANTSSYPILLQVNYESGHFSDEKYVRYRSLANAYAFVLWQAGHKDFQPIQK
jgi:prolyl oligopeptidase